MTSEEQKQFENEIYEIVYNATLKNLWGYNSSNAYECKTVEQLEFIHEKFGRCFKEIDTLCNLLQYLEENKISLNIDQIKTLYSIFQSSPRVFSKERQNKAMSLLKISKEEYMQNIELLNKFSNIIEKNNPDINISGEDIKLLVEIRDVKNTEREEYFKRNEGRLVAINNYSDQEVLSHIKAFDWFSIINNPKRLLYIFNSRKPIFNYIINDYLGLENKKTWGYWHQVFIENFSPIGISLSDAIPDFMSYYVNLNNPQFGTYCNYYRTLYNWDNTAFKLRYLLEIKAELKYFDKSTIDSTIASILESRQYNTLISDKYFEKTKDFLKSEKFFNTALEKSGTRFDISNFNRNYDSPINYIYDNIVNSK